MQSKTGASPAMCRLTGLTPAGVAHSWALGTAIYSAFGPGGYVLVCLYFILGSLVRPLSPPLEAEEYPGLKCTACCWRETLFALTLRSSSAQRGGGGVCDVNKSLSCLQHPASLCSCLKRYQVLGHTMATGAPLQRPTQLGKPFCRDSCAKKG